MPATSGVTSGTFTIPRTGETSANVWYRIYLTVRDSQGTTHDHLPRCQPANGHDHADATSGLQLTLDGQPFMASFTFTAVVGMIRTIGAPSPQIRGKFNVQVQVVVRRRRANTQHHDAGRDDDVLRRSFHER